MKLKKGTRSRFVNDKIKQAVLPSHKQIFMALGTKELTDIELEAWCIEELNRINNRKKGS